MFISIRRDSGIFSFLKEKCTVDSNLLFGGTIVGAAGVIYNKKWNYFVVFFFACGFASWASYFFLNLSTRPAVSIIFCLPVIKGWQLEQISTLMSFFVDLVSMTLPQTQVIVVSLYSG